jgi:hypothetical protein
MRRLLLLLTAFLSLAAALAGPAQAAWLWPVSGEVITPYRNGSDPYAGGQHRGIDIAAAVGTPVVASAAGEVRFAGTAGSSGLTVSVRTGDGFDTSYLHLSSLAVRAGEHVSGGERLGAVGTTGERSAAAPHLHFGVREAGTRHASLDPLSLLPPPPAPPPAQPPDPAPAPAPLTPGPAPAPVPRMAPAPGRAPRPVPAPGRAPHQQPAPRGAPRPIPAPGRGPHSAPAPGRGHRRAPSLGRAPGLALRSGTAAGLALRSGAAAGLALRSGAAPGQVPAPGRAHRSGPALGRAPGLALRSGRSPRGALTRLGARRPAPGPGGVPDTAGSSSSGPDFGWALACAGLLLAAGVLGLTDDGRKAGARGRSRVARALRPLLGGR